MKTRNLKLTFRNFNALAFCSFTRFARFEELDKRPFLCSAKYYLKKVLTKNWLSLGRID